MSIIVETSGDDNDAEDVAWTQFTERLTDGLNPDDFGAIVDFLSSDEDEVEA